MTKDKKLCLPNIVADMPWGDLTIKGMDLQMCIIEAICTAICTEQSKIIQIDLVWLKMTTGIPNYKELYDKLDILIPRMSGVNVINALVVDKIQQIATVTVADHFIRIIRQMEAKDYPYLRLDSDLFKSLHKKAAKIIYLQMCRFAKQKWWAVTVDDFKSRIGVKAETPNKYVMRDTVSPAIAELHKVNPCMQISCKVAKKQGLINTYYFRFDQKSNIR